MPISAATDNRNYVYFRFAGGLADPERRRRRARFISDVLKTMDFKVSVKGDLVIGRTKSDQPPILRAALSVLGALTAFSRQRDTSLFSDEDVTSLFTTFADLFIGDFQQVVAESYGDWQTALSAGFSRHERGTVIMAGDPETMIGKGIDHV